MRIDPESASASALEVVLHGAGSPRYRFVLEAFEEYAQQIGAEALVDRRLSVGDLCFVPVLAEPATRERLAQFSFLRVARSMPSFRPLEPLQAVARGVDDTIALPTDPAIDPDLRVAVFDGGVTETTPLSPWVTSKDTAGVGRAEQDLLDHGHAVTSALLFGPLDPNDPVPVPYAGVDHYRVLDARTGAVDPFELYDVLQRVEDVLTQSDYEFVNLSIGPRLPIEDDEVHSWTAVLDSFLNDGHTLATVAIGNDGKMDRPSGNARIQVPGDAVNALSVGSADSQGIQWGRAAYSCFGPGRTPGIVKPDVLGFGGQATEPFLVVLNDGLSSGDVRFGGVAGTSFAAPSVLRSALGVRSLFGERLHPLALKALVVHTSEESSAHDPHEHGWGRVCPDLERIVMCPDGVARVVYQGTLTAGKYLRAQLPYPHEQLDGMISIAATICFASEVEPDQPSNYTRSGLDVVFRPHSEKFKSNATAPKSDPFFTRHDVETEGELRADAHKWDTVMHRSTRKRASSLQNPVFDIHYNARLAGGDGTTAADQLRYAMVISVESARTPDLYDRVLRTYATQLEALVPASTSHCGARCRRDRRPVRTSTLGFDDVVCPVGRHGSCGSPATPRPPVVTRLQNMIEGSAEGKSRAKQR